MREDIKYFLIRLSKATTMIEVINLAGEYDEADLSEQERKDLGIVIDQIADHIFCQRRKAIPFSLN